jgi:hypothetical protein
MALDECFEQLHVGVFSLGEFLPLTKLCSEQGEGPEGHAILLLAFQRLPSPQPLLVDD